MLSRLKMRGQVNLGRVRLSYMNNICDSTVNTSSKNFRHAGMNQT